MNQYQQKIMDTHSPPFVLDHLQRALNIVRTHLRMDVAFVSQFVGDRRYFRYVDAKAGQAPFDVGDASPINEGYCKKIVDGHLPSLIRDAARDRVAAAIPETQNIPIGAHVGVPLRLSDGQLFGSFCCFRFDAAPHLRDTDLILLQTFADLFGCQFEIELEAAALQERKLARVKAVIESDQPDIVYQPIFRLADMTLNGAEALARFNIEPRMPPDKWFVEAAEVGLKSELELTAARRAIKSFRLADDAMLSLSINLSPQTVLADALDGILADKQDDKICIEITEHERVEDYPALRLALEPYRKRGIRIAVDDAGSGYASMSHVINLKPDIIKLDVSLTRAIEKDPVKMALACALVEFGHQIGCTLVAEGIETPSELATLRGLGVDLGQGYFLGRPMPFDDFQRLRRFPYPS